MAAITGVIQDLQSGSVEGSVIAWPAGATNVDFNVVLSNQDALNTSLSCGCQLLASTDGGKSFFNASGSEWMGGTAKDGVSPNFAVMSVGFQAGSTPTHVKQVLSVPSGQTLSIGATLTFS